MRRLQITLPPDVEEEIKALADAEHRSFRFQVEHIVIEAARSRQVNRQCEPVSAGTIHD